MKGQLEDAVSRMSFRHVHIFQPPILERGQFSRKFEQVGKACVGMVNKLGVLRSQTPMPVAFLAKQMISVSYRESGAKVTTYKPKRIWELELSEHEDR